MLHRFWYTLKYCFYICLIFIACLCACVYVCGWVCGLGVCGFTHNDVDIWYVCVVCVFVFVCVCVCSLIRFLEHIGLCYNPLAWGTECLGQFRLIPWLRTHVSRHGVNLALYDFHPLKLITPLGALELSALVPTIAWCLIAPSNYLEHYWLVTNRVPWHLPEDADQYNVYNYFDISLEPDNCGWILIIYIRCEDERR